MNMRKATDLQLNIIRFHDPMATLADKLSAMNEEIRRQERRSGKPVKVTSRSQGYRR